jgi:hypothetical protein
MGILLRHINFHRQTCSILLDSTVQIDFALVPAMLILFDFVAAAAAVLLGYR